MNGKAENPCLKFNCSACCNPVKMKNGFREKAGNGLKKLPFVFRDEELISETDNLKLEAYDCKLFDKNSRKCKDYENRPEVCKNTFCTAFKAENATEQKKIVDEIKQEKYFICGRK